MNVIGAFSVLLVLMFGLSFVLLFYTPLRVYTPVYDQLQTKQNIVELVHRADSLEHLAQMQTAYLRNLQALLQGEPGAYADSSMLRDTGALEPTPVQSVDSSALFARSAADSQLRAEFESSSSPYPSSSRTAAASAMEPQTPATLETARLSAFQFMAPVSDGLLSQGYNLSAHHPAIDLAAPQGQTVRACLPGVVVFAEWSAFTGYVMILQHADNLLSVYKHNARLMASPGTFVDVGEPIAMLGNTGAFSTGPHLHFELWHNGAALDPKEYITF